MLGTLTRAPSNGSIMSALTTRQRDLARLLLAAQTPEAVADLGGRVGLTRRQADYALKPLQAWFHVRGIDLVAVPGQGIALVCEPEQRGALLAELDGQAGFQLVLSSEQRQQLFALALLAAQRPLVLGELQHSAQVSRTTVLKDLTPLEPWFARFELKVTRKPNFGFALEGSELARRNGLAALLWGASPFGAPLFQTTYDRGLTFTLTGDQTLGIVRQANQLVAAWDVIDALEHVAMAEGQLHGRFADDSALQVALVLAIQSQRMRAGQWVSAEPALRAWLERRPIWAISEHLVARMNGGDVRPEWGDEIAATAMRLLAGTRSRMWPSDLELDPVLSEALSFVIAEAARALHLPSLANDDALRDGLAASLIPAALRARFGLWVPEAVGTVPAGEYEVEHGIAQQLALEVETEHGLRLDGDIIETLALLLHAANLRARPIHEHRVFVVCPSGMATAQLLLARLRTRFPHLHVIDVLSFRDLSPERINAQIVITTAPLPVTLPGSRVIQVSPLLSPQDVEAITQGLN